MGQQYLGAALLNKFETLHVQSFDLATILEDSTRVSHSSPALLGLLFDMSSVSGGHCCATFQRGPTPQA